MEILKETYQAVVTPQLLSSDFSMMPQNLVCAAGNRWPEAGLSDYIGAPSYVWWHPLNANVQITH